MEPTRLLCPFRENSYLEFSRQERILEWVAISSSRGCSWPRDQTCVSCISCTGRQILYHHTTWEAWPHWNPSPPPPFSLPHSNTLGPVPKGPFPCHRVYWKTLSKTDDIIGINTYPLKLKPGTQIGTYTPVLIAALFTKAETWKIKCLSTDEWINKILSIHTMECYLATKFLWYMLQHRWTLKTSC